MRHSWAVCVRVLVGEGAGVCKWPVQHDLKGLGEGTLPKTFAAFAAGFPTDFLQDKQGQWGSWREVCFHYFFASVNSVNLFRQVSLKQVWFVQGCYLECWQQLKQMPASHRLHSILANGCHIPRMALIYFSKDKLSSRSQDDIYQYITYLCLGSL